MKRNEIIKILENNFPKDNAQKEDYIGLQVKGSENIQKIIICLDLTLEVISQTIEKNANLIISHHPLFFGDKKELLKNNALLRAKYKLLKDKKINVFVIHTNADFNNNSIAFNLGLLFDNIKNIYSIENNSAVELQLKDKLTLKEISHEIKQKLNINYFFRENIDNDNHEFNNLVFASGAAGDIIFNYKIFTPKSLFIIGELKHHHWVFAKENNICILEISHFSETIFKEMVNIYLKDHKISSILASETNGYKQI